LLFKFEKLLHRSSRGITRNFLATRLGLGINDASVSQNYAICHNFFYKDLNFLRLGLFCFGPTSEKNLPCRHFLPISTVLIYSIEFSTHFKESWLTTYQDSVT